jgi:hypothetical protein
MFGRIMTQKIYTSSGSKTFLKLSPLLVESVYTEHIPKFTKSCVYIRNGRRIRNFTLKGHIILLILLIIKPDYLYKSIFTSVHLLLGLVRKTATTLSVSTEGI